MENRETVLVTLKILNNGGIHIPTQAEWMAIAEATCFIHHEKYDGVLTEAIKKSFNLSNKQSKVIKLQAKFEQMTRGEMVHVNKESVNTFDGGTVTLPTHKEKWQPAVLTTGHFVCEAKKYTPIIDGDFLNSDSTTYTDEKAKEYNQAKRNVWFEGDISANGFYLKHDITIWGYIIECEQVKANVTFTESFVDELLT